MHFLIFINILLKKYDIKKFEKILKQSSKLYEKKTNIFCLSLFFL